MAVRQESKDSPQASFIGPDPSELRHYENLDLTPPDLPFAAMENLLSLMGRDTWKIPSLEGRSLRELGSLARQEPKEVVRQCIEFCDSALQGGRAVRPDLFGLDKGPKRVAPQAVLDWQVASRVLEVGPEEVKTIVDGAHKALSLLLEEKDKEPTGQLVWDIGRAKRLIRSLFHYSGEWALAQDAMLRD